MSRVIKGRTTTETKRFTLAHMALNYTQVIWSLSWSGTELVSPRDLAYARIHGDNAAFNDLGGYVNAGFVFGMGRQPLLVRDIPQYDCDRQVDNVNWGIDSITDDQYEEFLIRAKKDQGKSPGTSYGLILPPGFIDNVSLYIPTDSFADHEITSWLYGDMARSYGRFLAQNNVNSAEFFFGKAYGIDAKRDEIRAYIGEDYPYLSLPMFVPVFCFGERDYEYRGFRTFLDSAVEQSYGLFFKLKLHSE